MQTDRLYYKDSHMREFDAQVLSCTPGKHGYDVVAVLSGRAGEHLRIKFPHMGILIVKSVRLHILNAPVIDDFLIF